MYAKLREGFKIKNYKPTTIQRSPLILTKFAHFVEKMGDLCGKLTKMHPLAAQGGEISVWQGCGKHL
jgi:hypothetical protein